MSLTLQNVTVGYRHMTVIDNVVCRFPAGQLTALIGPNGVGKSTLLKAIAGLLPCSGNMALNKAVLSHKDRHRQVFYMPQDSGVSSTLTAIEVILLARLGHLSLSVPRDIIAAAEAVLQSFGLAALQDRPLNSVSGGQRQLIYVAQAMFRAPGVLLLDEPTAALDLRHQLLVMETVRRQARQHNIIVGVAMHDLSLAAQFADQIICLQAGAIESSGPAENVLLADRLRRLYGVETEVDRRSNGQLRVTPIRSIAQKPI